MSLLLIAWRNMQQRGLASLLTILSMALGVALVVMVLSISWLVTESFDRNSNVGYNLIVGSKGSPLQLTLNTVYYLSRPIEVLPYEDYLEFLPGDERQAMIRKIGGTIWDPEKPGKHSQTMKGGFAIPVCLGDYYGSFRVVGTTSAFFQNLRYGNLSDIEYKFAEGRNFQDESVEHGFYEAVIGWQVAREMGKRVGDTFQLNHGDPEGEGHGQEFHIVGVVAPTGTPNDRAAFVNLEGFLLLDKHAREFANPAIAGHDLVDVTADPPANPKVAGRLPLGKRDLTAILLRPSSGFGAMRLEMEVNKSAHAMAASPIQQIATMLDFFVRPVQYALLALTFLVCIVSAVSILVSIYNSMNERRRDIAVMRALGARRDVVMSVILLESLLIALLGGALGWLIGHVAGFLASPMVEERTGIRVGLLSATSSLEIILLPIIIVLATLAGIVPAFIAYRTDVSKNLT